LASERQKLFNELYRLRGQLDEAEVNINEKEEVIESLKQVMQELSHPAPQLTEQQIEKKYKQEVYGTETPNIVVTVKGGSKTDSAQSKGKQSTLRKKVNHLHDKKEEEEKANFLPFIKGFFS
jgi:DNA gyrase/topoisomerase IV subunit A